MLEHEHVYMFERLHVRMLERLSMDTLAHRGICGDLNTVRGLKLAGLLSYWVC